MNIFTNIQILIICEHLGFFSSVKIFYFHEARKILFTVIIL